MASAEVEERWQAKRSTVAERSKYLLNNSLISNVKFAFPSSKRSIPAHKHVLAVSSPVFFAMFYGDLADGSDTVEITDCDPDIFLHFLRFIYSDEANFEDVDCAVDVWCLADKYDVPSLAKECANFIDGNIEPLKALAILPYARQSNDQDLERICWAVIDYNAEKVVADKSFLEIKHDLLLALVERKSLNIKEITLFKAVNGWAERRCEEAGKTVSGENKRAFLGEGLLRHFRFSLMSPGEFSYIVHPTEILLTSEVIDVFKKLNSVHPGDFKFSVSPRTKIGDAILHSCSTGRVYPSSSNGRIHLKPNAKSGLLTFAVNKKGMMLCGVRIVVCGRKQEHPENVPITLTISQKGKQIRQVNGQQCALEMKGTSFINYYHVWYGHVDVVFNRPVSLAVRTCYTIETETDSTHDVAWSVWPNKSWHLEFIPPMAGNDKTVAEHLTSRFYFGYCCGDICPGNQQYGGEIFELVFKSC